MKSLNKPFHGWTDAYTLVNGGFGVRSSDGQLTASLQATNLFNKEVQQHIFGDIIRRTVTAGLQVRF